MFTISHTRYTLVLVALNPHIPNLTLCKDDPRLLVLHDNSLLLTYATMTRGTKKQQFNTVILTLNSSTGKAQFGESIELKHSESGPAQKNWFCLYIQLIILVKLLHHVLDRVPFEYRRKVYYIQRINPLTIVRPDDNDTSPSVREARTVYKLDKVQLPWPVSFFIMLYYS